LDNIQTFKHREKFWSYHLKYHYLLRDNYVPRTMPNDFLNIIIWIMFRHVIHYLSHINVIIVPISIWLNKVQGGLYSWEVMELTFFSWRYDSKMGIFFSTMLQNLSPSLSSFSSLLPYSQYQCGIFWHQIVVIYLHKFSSGSSTPTEYPKFLFNSDSNSRN
jgi:hypothetical protein